MTTESQQPTRRFTTRSSTMIPLTVTASTTTTTVTSTTTMTVLTSITTTVKTTITTKITTLIQTTITKMTTTTMNTVKTINKNNMFATTESISVTTSSAMKILECNNFIVFMSQDVIKTNIVWNLQLKNLFSNEYIAAKEALSDTTDSGIFEVDRFIPLVNNQTEKTGVFFRARFKFCCPPYLTDDECRILKTEKASSKEKSLTEELTKIIQMNELLTSENDVVVKSSYNEGFKTSVEIDQIFEVSIKPIIAAASLDEVNNQILDENGTTLAEISEKLSDIFKLKTNKDEKRPEAESETEKINFAEIDPKELEESLGDGMSLSLNEYFVIADLCLAQDNILQSKILKLFITFFEILS